MRAVRLTWTLLDTHTHTRPGSRANLLHKHNFETDTRLAEMNPPPALANSENILGNLGSKLQAIHANGLEQRVALGPSWCQGQGQDLSGGRTTTLPGQIIFRAAPEKFSAGTPLAQWRARHKSRRAKGKTWSESLSPNGSGGGGSAKFVLAFGFMFLRRFSKQTRKEKRLRNGRVAELHWQKL